MSNHTSRSILKDGAAITILENESQVPVSEVVWLSAADAREIVFDITCSMLDPQTGMTLILQDSHNGSTWYNRKSTALGATAVTIKVTADDANDADYVPLRPLARLVVTTQASDAVTVATCWRTVRG